MANGRSAASLPKRYCRCTSIIGLANPHCEIHGNQQRQDSLTDQLCSVVRKANEMGCYDAADWITKRYEEVTLEGRTEVAAKGVEDDPK